MARECTGSPRIGALRATLDETYALMLGGLGAVVAVGAVARRRKPRG